MLTKIFRRLCLKSALSRIECLFRITFIRMSSHRRLALLQLALTHFSLRFLGRSHRVIMQKYDRLTWHTPFC